MNVMRLLDLYINNVFSRYRFKIAWPVCASEYLPLYGNELNLGLIGTSDSPCPTPANHVRVVPVTGYWWLMCPDREDRSYPYISNKTRTYQDSVTKLFNCIYRLPWSMSSLFQSVGKTSVMKGIDQSGPVSRDALDVISKINDTSCLILGWNLRTTRLIWYHSCLYDGVNITYGKELQKDTLGSTKEEVELLDASLNDMSIVLDYFTVV